MKSNIKQVELGSGGSVPLQHRSSSQLGSEQVHDTFEVKEITQDKEHSISKDRQRRHIKPPQRYGHANLLAYSLQVVEGTVDVGEPSTYS